MSFTPTPVLDGRTWQARQALSSKQTTSSDVSACVLWLSNSFIVQWDVPFNNLTSSAELRECFVRCLLPQKGLKLGEAKLENHDGLALATWVVEVHPVPLPRQSSSVYWNVFAPQCVHHISTGHRLVVCMPFLVCDLCPMWGRRNAMESDGIADMCLSDALPGQWAV
jgi:hypothetical protein